MYNQLLKKFIINNIFFIFIGVKRLILKIFKTLLLFRSANPKFRPDTVVVLKIGGLGDFIFGIPALNLLREKLPNAKIILITAKSLNKISFNFSNRDPLDFSDIPWVKLVSSKVDEILVVHDLSIKTIGKLLNLIPRSKNLGVFILGYPVMTISSAIKKLIFARLLTRGIKVCVGVDKKYDNSFMRKFQAQQGLYRHKMLGDVDSIMEGFPGYSFSEKDLNFSVTTSTIPGSVIAKSKGIKNSKNFILMAPIATTFHKQWPLDNFVRLTKELKKIQKDSEFILIGTSEQFEQADYAFKNIGIDIKNLCGSLSIEELTILFSNAKGYIGNDGGMSQLAGLVGCPSIIIMNSIEEDWITHPWRSANGLVRNHTSCSPCFNELYCPEGHRKCVVDITIESIILKANQIIFES
jgi:heptosyltransferase-2